MRILAIETSCDETAISIADFFGTKQRPRVRVYSNIVLSQVQLHKKFGGVVPNLAKREHQKNLVPILFEAFKEAEVLNEKVKTKNEKLKVKIKNIEKILEREPELLKKFKKYIVPLKSPKIDAIAVTYGPGLAPALWVGVNFAKALSCLWGKPLIPINHMTGHLYSGLLHENLKTPNVKRTPARDLPVPNMQTGARTGQTQNLAFSVRNLMFPAIALLVSGGHTELVLMRGYGKYKIIGETVDDAAGEAFDKVARLLGLGYPGGPAISALAKKLQTTNHKLQTALPRPMLNTKDYNFSFSGLKTAVLYLLRDHPELMKGKAGKAEVAKEFQNAVVDVLVAKTIRAAKVYRVKTVLLGGGVAANLLLRKKLDYAAQNMPYVSCFMPHASLTGDNALTIAFAAFLEKKNCLKILQNFPLTQTRAFILNNFMSRNLLPAYQFFVGFSFAHSYE